MTEEVKTIRLWRHAHPDVPGSALCLEKMFGRHCPICAHLRKLKKEMSQPRIIVAGKKYRITREGTKSDLFSFGYWYTKVSGFCSGPVWKLYKWRFFGWSQQSVTNDPRVVLRWKCEFIGRK